MYIWYGSTTSQDKQPLEKVCRDFKIIAHSLPTLAPPYNTRIAREAKNITFDPTHPAHHLFTLSSSIPSNTSCCVVGTVPTHKPSATWICTSTRQLLYYLAYLPFLFIFHNVTPAVFCTTNALSNVFLCCHSLLFMCPLGFRSCPLSFVLSGYIVEFVGRPKYIPSNCIFVLLK